MVNWAPLCPDPLLNMDIIYGWFPKGSVATYRDYELSMVAAERGEHFHLPDPLALERARFTKRLKDKWAEVGYLMPWGSLY